MIDMIAQVWENKVFETKKNNWENLQIDIEIKIKTNSQMTLFSLKNFNPWKKIKDRSFNHKNLYQTLAEKHLKYRKFSLPKSWWNQLKRRHIYSLSKICPLAVWKGQKWPSGRLPGRPAQRSYLWPLCLWSTARSTGATVIFMTVVPLVDRP